MARLHKLERDVLEILTHDEESRNNDKLLYYRLLERKGFNTDITLEDYLLGDIKYPCYDSVTRCRRKVQEHNKELRGNDIVQGFRDCEEIEYVNYAKTSTGGVGNGKLF